MAGSIFRVAGYTAMCSMTALAIVHSSRSSKVQIVVNLKVPTRDTVGFRLQGARPAGSISSSFHLSKGHL
jgi:hypothetical protein